MEKLNVLVLESDGGAADMAATTLVDAGHHVVRCHEGGHAAFPCNALTEGRSCPLEDTAVDVALDVRLHARTHPTATEDGAVCAVRQHVPLVVAGPDVLNPFEEFATENIGRDGDIVATIERVARSPLPQHTDAAARAMREVLDTRGLSIAPRVAVYRRHGSLVVEVAGGGLLDRATKDMAAVRMLAAVRALDSHAKGVDVAFVDGS
jgi:hypothetical protein